MGVRRSIRPSSPKIGLSRAHVLETLGSRHRLGLLSNFTDATPVRAVLEREGLAHHFHAIVISAEVGRRKPRPDVFWRVLSELDTTAERTLFVGDDPHDDVHGANAVGMRTAWLRTDEVPSLVRWLGRPSPAVPAEADYTLERLGDLLGILA